MQKLRAFLISLLLFIGFSVIGAFLGFILGVVFAFLDFSGVFTSWKLLDGPYGFSQIAGATSQTVWAQTEGGELYSWHFNCYLEPKCNEWIESQALPNDVYESGEESMEKSDSCYAISPQPPKEPPKKVVECAYGWYAGPEYGAITYYALLANGKIWGLQSSSSLIVVTVLPIYSSFGGLVLGMLAFIVLMILQRRGNKSQLVMKSSS